jgi:hypothetical protein
LENLLSTGGGFDLPMFVEVMVKASTKGREQNHAGLTTVERFMGVPSWREIAAASLVVSRLKRNVVRAELQFRRKCAANLSLLQKHNMLLTAQVYSVCQHLYASDIMYHDV